jgi:hypothetical protein
MLWMQVRGPWQQAIASHTCGDLPEKRAWRVQVWLMGECGRCAGTSGLVRLWSRAPGIAHRAQALQSPFDLRQQPLHAFDFARRAYMLTQPPQYLTPPAFIAMRNFVQGKVQSSFIILHVAEIWIDGV